jgi:hypothetical protein
MSREYKKIKVWHDVTPDVFKHEIQSLGEPAVLKGLVKSWPSTKAACQGVESFLDYLRNLYAGGKVECAKLPAKENGLFFYNSQFDGFNFVREALPFESFLNELTENSIKENSDVIALQSAPTEDYFPKFQEFNHFETFSDKYISRVWIGNDSIVNAHPYDSENIACVVAGKRKFTLFPPQQISNLYIGPLDFTPAGAAVSLVDFNNIDYKKFPKVKEALDQAFQVELDPGDAIYIPSLWWHHIEAQGGVNMLVNFWCGGAIAGEKYPFPLDNILMAILSVRSLPQVQKDAWREFFDYYVFSDQTDKHNHIPDSLKGVLADLSSKQDKGLRQWLIKQLKAHNSK